MQQLPNEELEALWLAAGATEPLPELSGDGIRALESLVEAMERHELDECGWRRWRFEGDDPYPAIAFTDSAYASLLAAAQVAGMVPLQCDRVQDMTLYVDPVPGPDGQFLAFLRDEEALPGQPLASFTSLEELLGWMTRVSGGGDAAPGSGLTDGAGFAADPLSGGGVLEGIIDLQATAGESLGGIWRAAAARRTDELVVEPGVGATIDPADRSPGWGRRLCLRALHRLLLGEGVPPESALDEQEMSAQQRDFIAHLRQLEQALRGEVPGLVIETMNGDNEALAERATDWLDTFEAGQEESRVAPTDFEQVLSLALHQILGALVVEGLLEVEPAMMPALVVELVGVAADAPTPKKMVRRLVAALVDSDLVEEVYADDKTLFDRFARGFGR